MIYLKVNFFGYPTKGKAINCAHSTYFQQEHKNVKQNCPSKFDTLIRRGTKKGFNF